MGVFYCSQCNLCTLYSCPQDLNPMLLIKNLKIKLQEKGLHKLYDVQYLSGNNRLKPRVNQRKISDKILNQRLGIIEYDREAPLEHFEFASKNYYIDLNSGKGLKYSSTVRVGEKVLKGQSIAQFKIERVAEGSEELNTALYSPVNGEILEISEKYIFIKKGEV